MAGESQEILKVFAASDEGKTGTMTRQQLTDVFKKIESFTQMSEDQIDALLYPWGDDKVKYEDFVYWLFGEAGKLKEMKSKNFVIGVFSCASYERDSLLSMNEELGMGFEFKFSHENLNVDTAHIAAGCQAVCVFVNDQVGGDCVRKLGAMGVKIIALRCAGFDRVDLEAAEECGVTVARVPAYSPHAVAEHAVTLMMCLNRKLPQAFHKTRSDNFSLKGLLGQDMIGKRIGVVGTGLIGSITCRILKQGFECDVVAYDKFPNKKISDPEPAGLGIPYMSLDELCETSDFISLHSPLLPETKHTINAEKIAKMKQGVLIVNTSRGGLVDTGALIDGLKSGKIAGCGLDVVEGEGPYFFQDFSRKIIKDKNLLLLMHLPNVILTAHQAFFTSEAMRTIAATTLSNVDGVRKGTGPPKQNGKLDTVCRPAGGAPRGPGMARVDLMPEFPPAAPPLEPPALPAVTNKAAGEFKVSVFSAAPYDQKAFDAMNASLGTGVTFIWHEAGLEADSAQLAAGCDAICIFVNDDCSGPVVRVLKGLGIKMIALRCAGFNNVDLDVAKECGIMVCRVPAYSPHSVAEHAVTLALGVNRRIPQAYNRTRSGDFTLQGLMGQDLGSDMGKKTVGIIGTGLIGSITAKIFKRGFDCTVIAYDAFPNKRISDPAPDGLGIPYVTLDELLARSDFISLHAPLLPATKHTINEAAINKMKDGVTIINTSRGGLIDTKALIKGIESGKVGACGLDVVEGEDPYFFKDFSGTPIMDDDIAVLLSYHNCCITAHQAFFSEEAMVTIAHTTISNLNACRNNEEPPKQKGKLDTVCLPTK